MRKLTVGQLNFEIRSFDWPREQWSEHWTLIFECRAALLFHETSASFVRRFRKPLFKIEKSERQLERGEACRPDLHLQLLDANSPAQITTVNKLRFCKCLFNYRFSYNSAIVVDWSHWWRIFNLWFRVPHRWSNPRRSGAGSRSSNEGCLFAGERRPMEEIPGSGGGKWATVDKRFESGTGRDRAVWTRDNMNATCVKLSFREFDDSIVSRMIVELTAYNAYALVHITQVACK